MMRKAFTLIEMTVAVALLVVVMAMSGVIFRVGIESQRLALANAEIMRKFRTITDQLDADLKGLCKDGEIFIIWDANDKGPQKGRHTGLDRIMFFSKGDFYAYGTTDTSNQAIRGNLARIFYGLTLPTDANFNDPAQRVLTRTQHILTADDELSGFGLLIPDPNNPKGLIPLDPNNPKDWQKWRNEQQWDRITLKQWVEKQDVAKENAWSVITDVAVGEPTVDRNYWGVRVSRNDPNTVQNILCESVGTFRIQGWYDPCQTWVPDDDLNDDLDYQDTDYFIDENRDENDEKPVSGVFHSPLLYFFVLNPEGRFSDLNINENDNLEDRFNALPGLGRALKFTFTLYDSRGLIPGGRTFTHIVYLDR